VAFGAHGVGEVLKGENQGAIWFFVAAAMIYLLLVLVVRPMLGKGDAQEGLD
jgi:hypothetical protein